MTFIENTNDKHVKRSSETLDGIGTSNLCDSNHEVCDGSESSVDSEEIGVKIGGEKESPGTGRSNNNGYLILNTKVVKSILIPNEALSSSSSSESSSNDFLQTRKANFAGSTVSNFASKDKESNVSHQSSIKSKPGNDFPVRVSTSPIYSMNSGHMNMFPTVAPPVQVMDQSSEYDPYRIPSSVFAVSTNTIDWTNDSDESLFSIQLGNPSLARDHLSTSPELGKSVELIESGELNMFSPQPSPLIEDKDTSRRIVETEDSQTTEMQDKDLKLEVSVDKNKNNLKNSYPAAVSYNSHVNGIGAQSSALPITSVHIPQNAFVHYREKKQEAPLCHCFTCSLPFCCLSWPSCSCPKCSLALCCCWHASPVLPEVENLNFVKKDNPHVTSHSTSNCCNLCQCFSWLCCTCCSHADNPRRQSYEKDSEKTSSSTSNCCNVCQCFSCLCCTCYSHADSTHRQSYEKDTEKTSRSTSNCSNVCQFFSWLCCTSCGSHTNNPRQQSCKNYSEKTSSSTSTCCNLCQCFSWLCCTSCRTNSPRQQSYEKDSKNISSSASHCCSLCQCFSWLCCTSCCSHPDSPRQQSYEKASKKASSSTSHCCSWFHCFSGPFCSWDNCCCCCCSETDSTRHQSLGKTSEKTSGSSSNCIQFCSWSCCSLEENKFSHTDNPRHRHQSFGKTSEKTSCSISNCCSWSMCSWLGKSSCSS